MPQMRSCPSSHECGTPKQNVPYPFSLVQLIKEHIFAPGFHGNLAFFIDFNY
jgi:hypothetical protein